MEREETMCSMVGCNNLYYSSEIEKSFYMFPKDFNLCMSWVQNCGHPEYFEDFAFAGAQPFLHRHICSEHFDDIDFVNQNPKLGLLPGSIPNLKPSFQKIGVKEEVVESGFSGQKISESELLSEVKLEKNNNNGEVNDNFSFSSTDDSCNDLHCSKLSAPETINVYKETEQDKVLSNEFFEKYKCAVSSRSSNARNYNRSRSNETEDERIIRLKREALRAKIRRSLESEDQRKLRRMKNALRAAFRRQNETPAQREIRKKKDKVRSARRRKAETESQTKIRRYNDAVRAAFRRNNESEEQRIERKMKDILRAAKRRSLETPEQRIERLRKDRERASKRRMFKKITKQITRLDGLSDLSLTIPVKNYSDTDPLTQCNVSSNTNHLQQVLELIENNTSKSNRTVKEPPEMNYFNNVINRLGSTSMFNKKL